MAKIIVQEKCETDTDWTDSALGEFETTQKAKSALAEKGKPGQAYRIADVKWEGKVAARDDTIITAKK